MPALRWRGAWSVELCRQHNNAQLIGVGARMHSTEEATEIVDAFLTTEFSTEPRHGRRIAILARYEQTRVAPPFP
jgi:ribose 5-phosphate isomerase B